MSVLTSLVLAAGLILGLGPRVGAATCSVTNARTGTRYGHLQAAVDASADNDILRVEGSCAGTTVIRWKSVQVVGVPSAAHPTPTLDGRKAGPVLIIRGSSVVLQDLTITNGRVRGRYGWGGGISLESQWRQTSLALRATSVTGNTATSCGGIFNRGGDLVLEGSTSVSGNSADFNGGGVCNGYDGTLTINDRATVSGNTALSGGGISIFEGTVELNDSSSVRGNNAVETGGGISHGIGKLTLNDSASVTGNTAGTEGGGIEHQRGRLILNGSASVTRNTAGTAGGGIYVDGRLAGVFICSDLVSISPNDPDDPPETLTCP